MVPEGAPIALTRMVDDGNQQEHKTTPPAKAPFPRTTPPPCDETTQKGASSSSSSPSAPRSTSLTITAESTILVSPGGRDEVALEKTAYAAEGDPETEERGKQAGVDSVAFCTGGQPSVKTKGRTAEELRERYRSASCHSFPVYGNSKDGIPVPDPMIRGLKDLLNGPGVGPVNTFKKRGPETRNKRLAQPLPKHVEPQRSSKRQRTQPEQDGPAEAADHATQQFAVAAPLFTVVTAEPSPVVDLTTDSQMSRDPEVSSSRSNHEPPASGRVREFRTVESQNACAGRKRPRRPKLYLSKSPKSAGSDWDIEDDLNTGEPVRKKPSLGEPKHNPKTAAYRPPLSKRASDEIEDDGSDDELGTHNGPSKKLNPPAPEEILDEDMASPTASVHDRPSADMIRVKFSNSKQANPDRPVLRVKRAVSGKHTLNIDELNEEDHPILQVGEDKNRLIAVDRTGEHCPDYRWLEIKLNLCYKIHYSMTKAPVAAISRSSGDGVAPYLVLEFADAGDAHTLGLWAEARSKPWPSPKVVCGPGDSDQLQKTFNNKWNLAVNYKPNPRALPDDLKLLEHNEANRANGAAESSSSSGPRQSLAQQNTPYQTRSQPLRNNMKIDGSASAPHIGPRTSSFFALNKDDQAQPVTRRLPPRQSKDTIARQTLNSSPSLSKRKSPSPILWTEQNPTWRGIWDEKPLIFPATGKNRASVYADDILRLEEGEYLNDSLIGFYLRYLQVNLEQENKALSDRIYIMNTYFYPKLTDVKAGRGINYDGVKSWTAKIDLFSFDYIVVPVNESAHWYLAIICNPAKLLKTTKAETTLEDVGSAQEPKEEGSVSTVDEQVKKMSLEERKPANAEQKAEDNDNKASSTKQRLPRKSMGALARKQDPNEARVITLDSLGVGHSPTCGNLKAYLIRELKDKKNVDVEPPATFGMTAKGIPEQEDHASCGAFLLGYMREFLKDPDGVVAKLVRKESPSWDISSMAMRSELRNIIIEQRKQQNARLAAEKKSRRKSNVQQQATSKSPEKHTESDSATPVTPQPVVETPRNISSTVKGSPVVHRLQTNGRSSPPAKKEVSDKADPVTEAGSTTQTEPTNDVEPAKHNEPHKPDEIAAAPADDGNDLLRPLENSSEEPKTPDRTQPHPEAPTVTAQLRTSPRHIKGKATDSDGAPKLLPPLNSSPPKPTGKKESGPKGPKERLSNSELLLCRLSSSPSKLAGKSDPASDGSIASMSPSQQLLGEMHSSSESTREQKSTSENIDGEDSKRQKEIIISDGETSKNTLRSMMKATHKSPYFSKKGSPQVKSSPTSATKRRPTCTETVTAIPSIEGDTEGQAHETGTKKSPAKECETVDLTN
ncbi:hypothetical protein EsH8_III_000560 [Colletotrichum jinshuiense]